ncbi:putative O-glycosylation ligase, exosortase A system-associated [Undibacterium parvum]|uniref:Putative O-glycosylation ligase, exosortase A system-associated n=1 Tax=Undibacterium parvum TaxID=401471 RepID=A0A3Q9BQI5_9BURK|nr:putative O-glycosylation ligase, exosortase A system-associated [Undibacterium parvum]AZP12222.1 putative O-glycosylation ligase, exosortase A system-associated [Undibacterium parvum]
MRDIFLLSILPILIFAMFQRAFIGLGLWIWTAMFFPNGWVYGIAGDVRYNLLFAGLTIVVYLMSKKKSQLQLGNIGGLVLLFLGWTLITTIFAIGIPELAWDIWSRLAKVIALFICILLIIDKKLHIDFFLWCLIFSVGFYASVEGLKYVNSGGVHNIRGMYGHILADRNELAVAFAMLLPICFYLLGEFGKKSWILKFGLIALITLVITSIIGTNSRGGLLALVAVGGYLFIKSKRKIWFAILVLCIGGAMVGLIPDQWFNRMDTISTADQDNSFLGRMVAWKLSFILASQNVFGGGFKALEYFPVWSSLSQDFYKFPFFYTGTAVPDTFGAHAAHSSYFQVLGDHGFIGLFIFISFIGLSFFKAGSIAKRARALNGPDWLISLATMLRLSLFAYAVGGAALSFAYFDMTYAIMALVLVLEQKFLVPLAASRELEARVASSA